MDVALTTLLEEKARTVETTVTAPSTRCSRPDLDYVTHFFIYNSFLPAVDIALFQTSRTSYSDSTIYLYQGKKFCVAGELIPLWGQGLAV